MSGQAPRRGSGKGLQDAQWLRSVANGNNRGVASLVAFPTGGQAGGTEIPAGAELVEIRTVGTAGDSLKLPFANASETGGWKKTVVNSTANSANVFAQPSVNKATGSLDTINGSSNVTAYAVAAGKSVTFFCPRDGVIFAQLGA